MDFFKKHRKEILIGLVSGLLNGLFGSGGGCIAVPAMEKFLKIDEKKSHATAIAIIFVMSAASSLFYIKNGFFDTNTWLYVTLGGGAGGAIGALLLSNISVKWLKIIFGGVISATALRLIF